MPEPLPSPRVTALAGGVGAARFLRGLVQVVDPAAVTVVGNTGDDEQFHGLHVSPDLDSVTYTLADASNPQTGWGLAGETFRCMEALERYGVETWFRLGDADLATHLYRTRRLREGVPLSTVTAEVARAWDLGVRLLPMTDDPAPTVIETAGGERLAMQDWFVGRRAEPAVSGVDLGAAGTAEPGPQVLDALERSDVVVICPSNPVVSVGPILAVPKIREALAARRGRVVGVSPIVGGAPVRGPADRLMRGLGIEVSPAGVARTYSDVCATLVVDEADVDGSAAVEEAGVRASVAPTLMHDAAAAARLALHVLRTAGISP